MNKLRVYPVIFAAVITLLTFAALHFPQKNSVPGPKDILQTWETSNNAFRVRVREYEDPSSIWLPRYLFEFASTTVGSDEWREIITDVADNDVPIPRDRVRFVNERVGYVFFRRKFAATSDGGLSWAVWDVSEHVPEWECCNQAFIEDVVIAADGTGTMRLKARFNHLNSTKLYTRNFGLQWSNE